MLEWPRKAELNFTFYKMDIINFERHVKRKEVKTESFFLQRKITPLFLILPPVYSYNTPVQYRSKYLAIALLVSLLLTGMACSRRASEPSSDAPNNSAETPITDSGDPQIQPSGVTPGHAADGTDTPQQPIDLTAIELGDQAMIAGDFEAAIAAYQDALTESPDNTDALKALAEALVAGGQPAAALPIYEQLLAADDADVTTLYNLGVAHMHLAQYDKAVTAYVALLNEADPDHTPALFNLAVAYQAMGQLGDARDTWERHLALDSENAEAHMRIAEVMLELGDVKTAEFHLRKSSGLAPNDLDAQLNTAAAARLNRNYGWVAIALRRAVTIEPNDPTIWVQMGDAMFIIYTQSQALPHLAEAVYAWEASYALDPDQPILRKRIDSHTDSVVGIDASTSFDTTSD